MAPFNEVGVNKKGLKKLYLADKCARVLLDYAARRTKNSNESRVERLLKHLSEGESTFSRRELISSLKQLEELGVGHFIIGRRGQPSRFQWSVAMIGVGKAARGDEDVTIERVNDVETVEDDDSGEMEVSEGSIRHVYKLRQDYDVTFDLPADLLEREASRLADFIRTLPFESA